MSMFMSSELPAWDLSCRQQDALSERHPRPDDIEKKQDSRTRRSTPLACIRISGPALEPVSILIRRD